MANFFKDYQAEVKARQQQEELQKFSYTETMLYKSEYEDDEIEVFEAENDSDAWEYACQQEQEHGTIFNLYEIDEENNDIIRIIL